MKLSDVATVKEVMILDENNKFVSATTYDSPKSIKVANKHTQDYFIGQNYLPGFMPEYSHEKDNNDDKILDFAPDFKPELERKKRKKIFFAVFVVLGIYLITHKK